MKRALLRSLFGTFFLLGLLLPPGCGTETGNPARDPAYETLPPHSSAAVALMDALCGKLTECLHDLSLTACRSEVAASTTLAPVFGVEAPPVLSYLDVLLEADSFRADPDALSRCLASIGALACDDPAVEAVRFVDGSIENLEQVVPGEGCPEVFSPVDPNANLSCLQEDLP